MLLYAFRLPAAFISLTIISISNISEYYIGTRFYVIQCENAPATCPVLY